MDSLFFEASSFCFGVPLFIVVTCLVQSSVGCFPVDALRVRHGKDHQVASSFLTLYLAVERNGLPGMDADVLEDVLGSP